VLRFLTHAWDSSPLQDSIYIIGGSVAGIQRISMSPYSVTTAPSAPSTTAALYRPSATYYEGRWRDSDPNRVIAWNERRACARACLRAGVLYLVGGASGAAPTGVFDDTYMLNVAAGATSWVAGPLLVRPRNGAAMAVTGGECMPKCACDEPVKPLTLTLACASCAKAGSTFLEAEVPRPRSS
jgi:hypothetical protein